MQEDRKADREEMKCNQEEMLANMDARQKEAEAMRNIMKAHHEDMLARMDASHKKMMAWLTDRNDTREETMVCLEKTEAHLEVEKPASMEIKPKGAHEEIPLEDAARMPVGEPRNGGRTNEIWPRCAARRSNGNGPRAKMSAEGIWSQSAEEQPAVRKWHGARDT
jgi:hypothetical protein